MRYQQNPNPEIVQYYQGTGYGPMNSFLRNYFVTKELINKHKKEYPVIKNIIEMDKVMKISPQLTNQVCYRGIPHDIFFNLQNKNSAHKFIERGYTSCSTSKKVTDRFIDSELKCCILAFKIPENIKTYQVKYSKNTSDEYIEHEIILQRNIEFIVHEQISRNVFTCIIRPISEQEFKKLAEEQEQLRKEWEEYSRKKLLESLDDSDLDSDDSDSE